MFFTENEISLEGENFTLSTILVSRPKLHKSANLVSNPKYQVTILY